MDDNWSPDLLLIISISASVFFGVRSASLEGLLHRAMENTEETEAYSAWRFATEYRNFWRPFLNADGSGPEGFMENGVYVKAFERSDVKYLGKSSKTGNGMYQVHAIIAGHYKVLEERGRAYKRLTDEQKVQGVWEFFDMTCVAHKLDAPGEWMMEDNTTVITKRTGYTSGLPLRKIDTDLSPVQ